MARQVSVLAVRIDWIVIPYGVTSAQLVRRIALREMTPGPTERI